MNKTRQLLIEEFINSLNEEKIPWIKDWSDSLSPRSGITNKPYRGTNKLLLSYIASKKGYKDPRWLTFNQIKDTSKKYHPKEKRHLKKGSKATPIEYWYIYDNSSKLYDNLNKLSYNLDEYKEKVEADPKIEIHCRLCCKTYLVFNAEEIEGIPALELNINNNINRDEFLQNIIKNMNVKFQELGSRAFYVPSDDIVTVPPKQIFKDSYAFHSTALHELAHATGHISRLSRDMSD